jgi:DNA-binding CsgD family transcriptional regulator
MRAAIEVSEGPYAVALDAISSFILDPYETAVPRLRAAVVMLDELDDAAFLELSYFAVTPAIALWDADAASRLLLRAVRVGRRAGALREVDGALWALSAVELSRTNPGLAGEYLAQAAELRYAVGHVDEQVVSASHLAWVGAPREQVHQIAEGLRAAAFAGVSRMADAALAIRDIADGAYAVAFTQLKALVDAPYLQSGFHQIPELVEAAVRSGNREEAEAAGGLLARLTLATGTPWVRGMSERARALLADGAEAEEHYLESIALLETAGHPGDVARGRLLYGEWLRRARRRGDARAQLRVAQSALDTVGATAFADRARRELRADGDRGRATVAADPVLTVQERSVARLASQGATNAEIAAVLFISPNTVDYHLRKVFRKLGVSSRRQLSGRVADA